MPKPAPDSFDTKRFQPHASVVIALAAGCTALAASAIALWANPTPVGLDRDDAPGCRDRPRGERPDQLLNDATARKVLTASGNWDYLRSAGYIVANLPAAGQAGRRAHVTDATATTFASVVAGGGSNFVPVVDTGTNWIIG